MKKIGKVFGLLILMLMLGVAGVGIYDWGKDRWVAPVSQKMEGEVRPNAEVEEQRRLLKERRPRSRETSRPPPRPPPGSVAEVRDLGRLLQEHNRQIAELDDRIMCLQLWITNNPGREWKDGQQPGHPLC